MKDLGILMTPANREAIVEGRQTMMRRLVKLPPLPTGTVWVRTEPSTHPETGRSIEGSYWFAIMKGQRVYRYFEAKAPYIIGQSLYIREPYYRYGKWVKNGQTKTGKQAWMFSPIPPGPRSHVVFDRDKLHTVRPNSYRKWGWYKHLALFMPMKFARTWLLVTDVKSPERIQEISEPDAVAEGINAEGCCRCPDEIAEGVRFCLHCNLSLHDLISEFKILWNSVYGEGSWDKNEWVWPMEFEKIEV